MLKNNRNIDQVNFKINCDLCTHVVNYILKSESKDDLPLSTNISQNGLIEKCDFDMFCTMS